jgi:CheY-like chemotaxis protein
VGVLVVEDDFLVAKGVVLCVQKAGYALAGQAADGLDALEKVAELKPDVILMDIQMPRMNGLEACAQIQKTTPTPVVILTAYESPEILQEASEAGAGAYLTKPPEENALERAITIAMARHGDIMKWRKSSDELEAKNRALKTALAEIKTLRGIVPMCCKCHKIRDDDGFWTQVSAYLNEHTEAQLSHGFCPECYQEELEELKLQRQRERER